MALHLTLSNRFESLLEALVANVGRASVDPFSPDRVIVPSTGVRRRIELAAAEAHGICANVEFSYLAQWLWAQIRSVVAVEEESPFAPSRLAWRVFRILGEAEFTAAHPLLARYLTGADALMRYDLAVHTASLFDHYITYRPDWLDAWRRQRRIEGPRTIDAPFAHEAWQAALWRRVADELGASGRHPSRAFLDALVSEGASCTHAGGAHVFCLPAIPPLYLDILRELARSTELHLYVLNPCREWWFEIVQPRRLASLRAQGRAEHHEVANTLLAQWGTQTQSHLKLLFERSDAAVEEDRFVAAEPTTLLARVQASILTLAELAPGSLGPLREADRSIEVHVCHSLARQLEVLQDQLLAMFAADASLRPGDVLVVTPALQEAAPVIDAVFGNAPEARRIPYSITGRARSVANVAARALLDVLAFAGSRFEASAFFELMQQPIVARRFGIDAARLDSIRRWLRAAGIRWGIDGAHRHALDLPADERYTFEDGLDRLFLGYALPSHDGGGSNRPWVARLPAGDAEGSEALALGALWRVLQALRELQRELARPRTGSRWFDELMRVADAFLDPADEELEAVRELEDELRTLRGDVVRGTGDVPLGSDVLRTALQAALDDPARGGVPGGAVTFASMTSLRNLPYRVVCMVGLDDGAFPALDRPVEFDLIAAAPRSGDRQRRTEDRNVFLDLLLAARDRLHLSYTGRDIRDNGVRPPSVLIADLLDAIVPAIASRGAGADALARARARLLVEHPLQAFSLDYFVATGDARKRSYNEEYCAALQSRLTKPVEVTGTLPQSSGDDDADDVLPQDASVPFFATALSEPGEEWQTVTLDQLLQFFRNPCRYLLTRRMGLALPEGEGELEDSEPFTLEFTARSALARRLLPSLLAGIGRDALRELAYAGTECPSGHFGAEVVEAELDALEAFAQGLQPALAPQLVSEPLGPQTFEVGGKALVLDARLGDLRASGLVRYRYDDARPADYLQGWIEHLVLNACQPKRVLARTAWHSRDGVYVLEPVASARAHLEALLALYVHGLRKPLHFYPKSAWCYATRHSLGAAAGKWQSTRFHRHAEDRDPAYRLCLRGVANPLDADFVRCADAVFAPLLDPAVIVDPRLAL